ncbi:MAG TPA: FadR/GntR family transcriptional regulator [Pseudogracilibacillus sp.]|nr:FadR/GntR family transcriptional regulator [Pseudogracilibacillus sp.]
MRNENFELADRVHLQVIDFIKNEIETGNIKPGERLPSERQLVEKLGISRTSVKEAFAALSLSGIIEIKQKSGATLLKDEKKDIVLKLTSIINRSSLDIIEIMELRQTIECEACFLASTRRTESDVIELKKKFDELSNAINKGDLAAKEDVNFHLAVAYATNNSLFVDVMRLLSLRMFDTISSTRKQTLRKPGKSEEVLKEHKNVYLAIKNKQPQVARNLMQEHLNNVKKRYL